MSAISKTLSSFTRLRNTRTHFRFSTKQKPAKTNCVRFSLDKYLPSMSQSRVTISSLHFSFNKIPRCCFWITSFLLLIIITFVKLKRQFVSVSSRNKNNKHCFFKLCWALRGYSFKHWKVFFLLLWSKQIWEVAVLYYISIWYLLF